MTRRGATLTGMVAVLLWSALALLTVGSAPVPPLQLNAMCFAIGGALGLAWLAVRGEIREILKVPPGVCAFGTLGLFGYHALYFSALRLAPAAEAGLIAYLWPLLIVLFSGLLPGERLRPGHALGAALGLCGAALIVLGGGRVAGFDPDHIAGYGLAIACALTWSGYSVLSRRLGKIPSTSVALFCLATAALSAALHVAFEDTVWPTGALGWASVAGLGLGPVGLAFYVWDIGVKHGDIQLLGTSSYAAPLLSTAILVAAGLATATWQLGLAAALIAGGAALAARTSFRA